MPARNILDVTFMIAIIVVIYRNVSETLAKNLEYDVKLSITYFSNPIPYS